jgi:hypothetical protein
MFTTSVFMSAVSSSSFYGFLFPASRLLAPLPTNQKIPASYKIKYKCSKCLDRRYFAGQ